MEVRYTSEPYVKGTILAVQVKFTFKSNTAETSWYRVKSSWVGFVQVYRQCHGVLLCAFRCRAREVYRWRKPSESLPAGHTETKRQ